MCLVWAQGFTLESIAAQRGVRLETVQGYLADAIAGGYAYDWHRCGVSSATLQAVGCACSQLLCPALAVNAEMLLDCTPAQIPTSPHSHPEHARDASPTNFCSSLCPRPPLRQVSTKDCQSSSFPESINGASLSDLPSLGASSLTMHVQYGASRGSCSNLPEDAPLKIGPPGAGSSGQVGGPAVSSVGGPAGGCHSSATAAMPGAPPNSRTAEQPRCSAVFDSAGTAVPSQGPTVWPEVSTVEAACPAHIDRDPVEQLHLSTAEQPQLCPARQEASAVLVSHPAGSQDGLAGHELSPPVPPLCPPELQELTDSFPCAALKEFSEHGRVRLLKELVPENVTHSQIRLSIAHLSRLKALKLTCEMGEASKES